VTGLYPDHHGLIDNTFYDAGRDTFYSIRQRDKVEDPYYYGGLPIWQLVQQNGMKAASYFWVGSEAQLVVNIQAIIIVSTTKYLILSVFKRYLIG
jgi:predicted AlkP superfamily pyrophosphatase or phosphodiesterase